jgi:hypothetical protein
MHVKIGDKVRFLNEKGEGVVSKLLNKTTVGVTIEDGFEIPFAISQLLLIEEIKKLEAKKETPNIILPIGEKRMIKNEEQAGVYLGFSPENNKDISHSDFNVWLINNTDYDVLFSYSIFSMNGFKTIETGTLKALEHELIETIDQKLLVENTNIKLDVLFYNQKEHEHQLPISEAIKLKPIKFYKENAFAENNFIADKALIITVYKLEDAYSEDYDTPKVDLSKLLFQKYNRLELPKKSKPHANHNPAYEMEVDLHIEELLENYSGMSNAEIIQVQLKHFQKTLDQAINEHCRKLVVIHGVGNGRLKQEVRTILASYKNIRIHDGSYSKYGFGATEILIS